MSFQNAKVVSVGVNPQDYHNQKEKRGTKEFAISPSSLREFAKCPRRWVDGYESPESEAKKYGSLLDCRLTTPDEFEERYAVRPDTYIAEVKKERVEKPWNGNATFCSEWKQQQLDNGKEIVTSYEMKNCDDAISRLKSDEIIAAWLDACDMQVLVAGEWHDEKTGLVIPVRCLIDFRPRLETEFAKCLGDLKSTRNASIGAWNRWCFTAGYHIQGAFDTDLYVEATKEDRMTWCFIVQENFAPWQTAKRMLSVEHGLDLGRMEYKRMLELYCRCLKAGQWPDYDGHDESIQGWSLVTAEPWQESRLLFEPKMLTEEPETEEAPVDIIP